MSVCCVGSPSRLYNEVDGLAALTRDISLGRKWLTDMNNGAAASGLHIQYCLSYPRHLLQSVELPAVVQARSSRDYEPGNTGWDNWLAETRSSARR